MALFTISNLIAFSIGCIGGAVVYACLNYGIPYLKHWRAECRREALARKAFEEQRWQILKPHFMSGTITEFRFCLRYSDWTKEMVLKGPSFQAICSLHMGTSAEKDPNKIGDQVKEALGSPGTNKKDMRRIAKILVKSIRRDQDVPVLFDDVVPNAGVIRTMASESVLEFRRTG